MSNIKAILTDFDGTLVNTFEANYYAYRDVLIKYQINLQRNDYKQVYGYDFINMMKRISDNLTGDDLIKIKAEKSKIYPKYFSLVTVNRPLLNFIAAFHSERNYTAIVSTANIVNISNLVDYFKIGAYFDIIISAENILQNKPFPECYLVAAKKLKVNIINCLIFEDSDVGIKAAKMSGANYIKITKFK